MRRFLLIVTLFSSLTVFAATPPVADAQNVTVNEDGSLDITLTGSDADNDPLSFALGSTNVAHGTLVQVGTTNTYTYTPTANYNGPDAFSFKVTAGGETVEATINITVEAVNDAPTLDAIADPAAINEDAAVQTVNLSGIGTGATDESQTLVVTATSSNPALIPDPTVVYTSGDATGTLTYTPVANMSGSATITVTVSDGGTENATVTQTFVINVTAVNDAPSFTKGADQTVLEDAAAQSISGWATAISAGPADEEATQTLNFVVTNDNNSLFSVQPAIAADGTLTYTLAPNANGIANVTVKLQDGGSINNESAEQTFVINVTPVNDAPVATDVTVNGAEDASSIPGSVSVTDADGLTGMNYSVVEGVDASEGGLNFNSTTGSFDFVPAANFNGTVTFTYQASDGTDASNVATVTIEVAAVNDAPTFVKGEDKTHQEDDGAQSFDGWATAITLGPSDESGQSRTFVVTNDKPALFTTDGQPAIDATGKLTYTLAADANGVANVTVKLQDNGTTVNGGDNESDLQAFTITVNPVNDKPVAIAESYTLIKPGTVEIKLKAIDVDGDQLTFALDNITVLHGNLNLKVGTTDTYIYSQISSYTGPDAFNFTVSDGEFTSAPALVTIAAIGPSVGTPELIFNEFYVDPAVGTQEFFELVNTSTEPINADCYTLIVYFNEKGMGKNGTARGYYVLDLPNVWVDPGKYFVGASEEVFDFQGKKDKGANFSWNTFLDSTGVQLTGGSLKKYTLQTNGTYRIVDTTLADLFFENKDNENGGVRYAMMLFNRGIYVNGFFGGHNSGEWTTDLLTKLGMPALPYTISCGSSSVSYSMDLSKLPATEHVTETSGKTDNGYIRKYDGICGEWVKASSGGNNETNTVEHTPGRRNGYSNVNPDGLTTSAQLDVCGNRIEVQVSGAKYAYVFPVTVIVYEDDVEYGILDDNDVYLTSIQINEASSLYHPITGYPDPSDPTKMLSFSSEKKYLLVYRAAMGCLDRIITPDFPGLTTTQRNFCGNFIDYSLSGGTGSTPDDYIPVNVNIYADINGNRVLDSEDPLVNPEPLVIEGYSSTIYKYDLEKTNYSGYSNYFLVYNSDKDDQGCVTKTIRASATSGSLNTEQGITCDQILGGYQISYKLTGTTGDARSYSLPVSVTIFIDKDGSSSYTSGDFLIKDGISLANVGAGGTWDEKKISYLDGEQWYIEYKTESGCFSRTVPVAKGCWALPVNLKTFTASRNKQVVNLKWETAMEQKNKGFYIQRNVRGMWENRAFVPSTATGGNSNTPLSYTFNDANEEKGVSQYRLQQVDLDNKTAYSPIRSVPGLEQANKVVIYPNPSDAGKFNVVFSDQGFKRVVVSDVSGRVVRQYRSVQNSLVVDQLEPGMYTVQIIDLSSAETSVEKVIIKKR